MWFNGGRMKQHTSTQETAMTGNKRYKVMHRRIKGGEDEMLACFDKAVAAIRYVRAQRGMNITWIGSGRRNVAGAYWIDTTNNDPPDPITPAEEVGIWA